MNRIQQFAKIAGERAVRRGERRVTSDEAQNYLRRKYGNDPASSGYSDMLREYDRKLEEAKPHTIDSFPFPLTWTLEYGTLGALGGGLSSLLVDLIRGKKLRTKRALVAALLGGLAGAAAPIAYSYWRYRPYDALRPGRPGTNINSAALTGSEFESISNAELSRIDKEHASQEDLRNRILNSNTRGPFGLYELLGL